MPPAVVAAAVTTAVTVATASAATAITTAFVVGTFIKAAVINFAIQALSPKPSIPNIGGSFAQSHTVTSRQSNASRKIVYGQTRVGGPYGFIKTSSDESKLGMTILLSVGEIEEITTIFFNGEAVTLDGAGNITGPAPYTSGNGAVAKFTGTSSQNAPSAFLSDYDYPSTATLTDVAYVALSLIKSADDSFPNGAPNVSALVKGRKVYDPRTSSTAYSNNPALVIRDYLTDTEYGLGVTSSEINDTSFTAAANICDEDVTLAAGGTEKRYTFNGVVDTANTPKSNLEQMLTCLAGTLYYSNGKWSLKAGAYVTPSVTLDEDDLAGAMQIDTAISRRDAYNAVKGQFISPESNYQATDYPPITSSTFETEDGGDRAYLDFALPFTQSSATAQRLAKIALFKNRQKISVAAKFKLTAFQFEVGDTLMLTNSRLGFSSKVFEVQSWALNFGADEVSVDCQLVETNSAVYSWTAEEAVFQQDNTTLPDPFNLVAPSFTATDEVRALNQTAISVLIVDVQSPSIYAKNFEVQAKKTTETEYTSMGVGSGNKFELLDVEDSATYDIRARIINRLGVQSPFRTGQHQVVGKTAPPQDVTNFSVNIINTEAHLSWTPVTDLDLSHYHIRHARETSGATYSNSIDLAPKVSRPANTVIVPAMTGTYFIKAVDKLGNASTNATSKVAIIEDIKGLNAVATSTQHPAFSGAKSGTVVVDNVLKLKSAINFDDLAGNFDDAPGLFDGAGGNTGTSGTYDFDNYVDLGQVFTSRVTATVKVQRAEYVSLFDSREGLFDDAVGTFDGDVQAFDDTNVELQVAVTNDDPAGSPTYTDFAPFFVGDYKARAFKFRAKLTSTDEQASPEVTQLSVTVDMPDRTVAVADTASGAGAKAITFSPAFKALQGIGITAQNLNSGDYYAITSKSATGFTITFYNSSNAAVDRTFDFVAKGYGEVAA
jgi:hypothetical protein